MDSPFRESFLRYRKLPHTKHGKIFAKYILIIVVLAFAVALSPRKDTITVDRKWMTEEFVKTSRGELYSREYWFSECERTHGVTYAQWLDLQENETVVLCTQAGRIVQILHPSDTKNSRTN